MARFRTDFTYISDYYVEDRRSHSYQYVIHSTMHIGVVSTLYNTTSSMYTSICSGIGPILGAVEISRSNNKIRVTPQIHRNMQHHLHAADIYTTGEVKYARILHSIRTSCVDHKRHLKTFRSSCPPLETSANQRRTCLDSISKLTYPNPSTLAHSYTLPFSFHDTRS